MRGVVVEGSTRRIASQTPHLASLGPDRRQFGTGALAALALAAFGVPIGAAQAEALPLAAPRPFRADDPVRLARALAARPFVPPPETAPEWRDLSYDVFRKIWFDGRRALLSGSGAGLVVEPFLAGRGFVHKVELHLVEGGTARAVGFDLAAFARTDRFPDLPAEGTGFSGLRLTGAPGTPGARLGQIAAFQGASYFRAIAAGQAWGLSARGLALGSGDPDEEFPLFRAFWIEAPGRAYGPPALRLHALLDGPSIAGAFVFDIRAGELAAGRPTVMDVTARLFPRREIRNAGLAPLTSMFLFNSMARNGHDDHRGAVHDSDGLLMLNGAGEWLWRPLANPAGVAFSAFVDSAPRGFGLMQRQRDGRVFADLEAGYERRPSLWVEPLGDWGPGRVVLVELPTPDETHDNIVAFWRPDAPLPAGGELRLSYRLHWGADLPGGPAVAPVIESRSGLRPFEPGRLYTIDWAAHPALGGGAAGLSAEVRATSGQVTSAVVQDNPHTGGVRLALNLLGAAPGTELRAELRRAGRSAGETWLWREARA